MSKAEYQRDWRRCNLERVRARERAWRARNKDKANAANRHYYRTHLERLRARGRAWARAHRDERSLYLAAYNQRPEVKQRKQAASRAYYWRNRDACILRMRAYHRTEKFRGVNRAYKRKRLGEDVQCRLAKNLRAVVGRACRSRHTGRNVSAVRHLGCSMRAFVAHMESKFQPGMRWDNYGAWHVDHIRPLASFDLTDPAQQRAAVHFSNLQPLWAHDNHAKHSRYAGRVWRVSRKAA